VETKTSAEVAENFSYGLFFHADAHFNSTSQFEKIKISEFQKLKKNIRLKERVSRFYYIPYES
jgi:hypothetical protein